MIGRSPALPALNAAFRLASPTVSELRVGAEGRANGVTSTRGVDAVPVPAAFVAATPTYYAVPLVRPVIEQLVAPLVEHVARQWFPCCSGMPRHVSADRGPACGCRSRPAHVGRGSVGDRGDDLCSRGTVRGVAAAAWHGRCTSADGVVGPQLNGVRRAVGEAADRERARQGSRRDPVRSAVKAVVELGDR